MKHETVGNAALSVPKKLLSIILSLCMLFSITTGLDLSTYAATSGDYEYTILDDGTAEITGYNGSAKSLSIPSKLNGYTVTTIDNSVFYGNKNLVSVTIPDSIIKIYYHAFNSCSALKSIKFGANLQYIGWASFAFCDSLKSVDIPSNVNDVDEGAFASCSSLTKINVDKSNKSYKTVNGVLFNYDLSKIICYPAGIQNESYAIPNSVKMIYPDAFYGCKMLKNISIPDSVTSIENYAFYGCSGISDIKLPDSLENIGRQAFRSCTSLRSITIPDSVTSIGEDAFQYCISMKKVIVGNGLTYFSGSNFCLCDSLSYIYLGSNIKEVDGFVYLDGLETIVVSNDNQYLCTVDSVLFNREMTKIFAYPRNKKNTEYKIPNTVISFSANTFYGNKALKKIIIGKKVEIIPYEAFRGCENLIDITIPNGVTKIEGGAFCECKNLTNINIPDSVIEIGNWAFADCALADVYYSGTKSDWRKINIGEYSNGNLTNARIHCSDGILDITHKRTITKATLKQDGEIVESCNNCGYSYIWISRPETIKLSTTSYTYNGKVKKPSVTVKDSNGKAIAASNYTVTYASGCKNVGKYSVKITFKGNYSGTKTLYFTIKPKNTSISSLTAGSKKFTVKLKKYTTQTTGYEVQYATNSSFKSAKTVSMKNTTTSKTISKLSGKKKYYVRVRTYKTVNGTKYYSDWSKAKTVTTKK